MVVVSTVVAVPVPVILRLAGQVTVPALVTEPVMDPALVTGVAVVMVPAITPLLATITGKVTAAAIL